MYRRLIKICFIRTYALLDFPWDAKIAISLIH
jgi:hypothetical protein